MQELEALSLCEENARLTRNACRPDRGGRPQQCSASCSGATQPQKQSPVGSRILWQPQNTKRITEYCEQLVDSLQPTEEDASARRKFVQKLQLLVDIALRQRYGADFTKVYGGTLHVFGSSEAGLHLPGADLDVLLSLTQEVSSASKSGLVQVFATAFEKAGMRDVVPIPGARVPIVRVCDPVCGLSADISVNNRLPLANTLLLRTYTLIDERVRQLCYLVKRWAKQRGLAEAFHHTPSSYAWVNLVLFFCQHRAIVPNLQALAAGAPPSEPNAAEADSTFSASLLTSDGRRVQARFCADAEVARQALGRQTAEEGCCSPASRTAGVGELLLAFFELFSQFDFCARIVSVRCGAELDGQLPSRSQPDLNHISTISQPDRNPRGRPPRPLLGRSTTQALIRKVDHPGPY
jgi:DNA polymerase sigma